nr:MAG TPA: hypothetical protein [Caudoviricetes sp.]
MKPFWFHFGNISEPQLNVTKRNGPSFGYFS